MLCEQGAQSFVLPVVPNGHRKLGAAIADRTHSRYAHFALDTGLDGERDERCFCGFIESREPLEQLFAGRGNRSEEAVAARFRGEPHDEITLDADVIPVERSNGDSAAVS